MDHFREDIQGTTTQVYFGFGVAKQKLVQMVNQSTGFVFSASVAESDYGKQLLACLALTDDSQVRIVRSEAPTQRLSDSLADSFLELGISALVGIGGGSILDLTKVIRKNISTKKRCELTLVPTTFGSGSELSLGAILTDARGYKYSVKGEVMRADVAIVDPHFMHSLPRSVLIYSGFDALAHAIETTLSSRATEVSLRYSIPAINQILLALSSLMMKGSLDQSNFEVLARNSSRVGLSLGCSSTCLPHRIQYAMAPFFNRSHAEMLAAVYPAWLGIGRRLCPELFVEKLSTYCKLSLLDEVVGECHKGVAKVSPSVDLLSILENQLVGDLAADPSWCEGYPWHEIAEAL